MVDYSKVAAQIVKGFKTAKGSIYSFDEVTNTATRYKADFSKADEMAKGGIKEPHLVGFLNHRQAEVAETGYGPKGWREYDDCYFGVLSKDLDHLDAVDPSEFGTALKNIKKGSDWMPIADFRLAEEANKGVHFIASRESTGEWESFGVVSSLPKIGLQPYEMMLNHSGIGKAEFGRWHLGNKIVEIYDNAQQLAAAIARDGLPVQIGPNGHLIEKISQVFDGPKALAVAMESGNELLLRAKDGMYRAFDPLTQAFGNPLRVLFGDNASQVEIVRDGVAHTGKIIGTQNGATSKAMKMSTPDGTLRLNFQEGSEGTLNLRVQPPEHVFGGVRTLDPNKP